MKLSNLIKLVIIGGSNAYWEIKELINDINQVSARYQIIGILDDNEVLIGKSYDGIVINGPIDLAKKYPEDVKFVFAIGSHSTRIIRESILVRLGIQQDRFVTLIHPSAKIFSTADIGPGCIVHYGTVIFHESRIGPFCIVAANCVIAVRNLIGRGSLLGSSITTTLGVRIGCFSFIGSGSNIGEGVEIGPGAKIGMGSLILKDVMGGAFVLGNPPRILDKVDVPISIVEEWIAVKAKY